ncbi:MAG: M23 family metallopeptidase [Chloroflexota bacterium]
MRLTFHRYFVFVLALLTLALPVISIAQEETPPVAPTPTPAPALPQVTTPQERPQAYETLTVDDLTLELLFPGLKQGRAALLRLTGPDVNGARLRFLDKVTAFFHVEGDGYYAFIVAGMDQTPGRTYDFTVQAIRADGSTVSIPGEVRVDLGGFIRQDIVVPVERAYLVDPLVERTELARMETFFTEFTPEQLWDEDGFQYPINAPTTSPFGAFRTFNNTTETRHTGWDIRAAIGTPVMAMGTGEVVFAGLLDIRGNHVIIDHGYGVYSGYSHLSQVHVTRGQTVRRGQIIGVSGNSGRSSGPHLHWELVINDEWVDVVDFLNTWIP